MKAIKIMTAALFFGLLVGCADPSHIADEKVWQFMTTAIMVAGVVALEMFRTERKDKRIKRMERQLAYLQLTIQQDNRWMAYNLIAYNLTERYLKLFADNWDYVELESPDDLRKRIGLDPHDRKPEVKTIPRAEIEKILHEHSEAVVCINGKLMAKDIRKVLEDNQ